MTFLFDKNDDKKENPLYEIAYVFVAFTSIIKPTMVSI